ncbi:hypothetical protein [Cohnella hashimotonis]|uniref:Uncharacterized protein n=1 Tax=Cohnella hashimotonis TaxID=2826895 RepID=A0ABT6TKL9_9BACL|nr:hypothetical protein [Cohnella hashimotonis]MDI4647402.1 hypothetical protein [Cohnella hashimotonis]
MLNWIVRMSPWYRDKRKQLVRASMKTQDALIQYRSASRQLQQEIRRNNFAKYLIYEKGE